MKPLKDYVLILPNNPPEVMYGSIVVPNSKAKANKGKVVSIGPEVNYWTNGEIKVGDNVFFGEYSATEVEIDRVVHYLVQEKNILANER